MVLCGAGQDSLEEHLGVGSNVNHVGGIPGSYFAFGRSASVGRGKRREKRKC